MRPGSIILTQEGMVFGTPEFMSPEQAQGKPLTPASDTYSLAVILYEVLTGKLPFEAKTAMEYIQAHVSAPPIPIDIRTGKKFPPLLWQAIDRALKKEPEERFASAADFATAMQAVLAGETKMPATLAPPPAPLPPPPPPPPAAPPLVSRDPTATKPERGAQKRIAKATAVPIGMLAAVAAMCLVLGVLLTVIAMKVLGH
jgi:serine/threonine-protein kinase